MRSPVTVSFSTFPQCRNFVLTPTLGQRDDLFLLFVNELLGLDPGHLVRHEVASQFGVGIEAEVAEEVHEAVLS